MSPTTTRRAAVLAALTGIAGAALPAAAIAEEVAPSAAAPALPAAFAGGGLFVGTVDGWHNLAIHPDDAGGLRLTLARIGPGTDTGEHTVEAADNPALHDAAAALIAALLAA